ncbi:WYL domain-containing protein [Novosphingobium sp. AAP1]|uniref:WYL domain-containing protein n=1 Tax=Novosphingobium sp. AAP1 TaxID=1523413 RepID=UPI000AF64953|nr:WYL domain-containing protein [Novosphingobium sp. AAP1]
MQQNQNSSGTPETADSAPDIEQSVHMLGFAIANKLCVRAVYNRGNVTLAPHALFERHGAPHIDAVVHDRDGVAPVEEKLGTFRLSGLRDVILTSEPAKVFAGFDPADERYGEKLLAAIAV